MPDRISTLDQGYVAGDLSIYPLATDTKDQLYQVANGTTTTLSRSITYSSKYLIVDGTSDFPTNGLILLGEEIIYYGSKTDNSFRDLVRGFAKSLQSPWSAGTKIYGSVFAETHNATKDAIINLEKNVGLKVNPEPASINGILKSLESRFLAPKAIFKASATTGAAPFTVQFQNFSAANSIRFLWDFGDGSTSVEYAPTHTYFADGQYTVKLNIITSSGAMGVNTKKNYIKVDPIYAEGYFYVSPMAGFTSTVFNFVDQTPGEITSRYWIFGDGETQTVLDPDIHTTTHSYVSSGTYDVTLILIFSDNRLVRYNEQVMVN